jgi:hypothetical protein
MAALLALQHFHGRSIEGYCDSPPRLRLVGMHPGLLPFHIDLIPAKACDVGRTESGSERERRHVPQMLREFLQQHRRLVLRQTGYAASAL